MKAVVKTKSGPGNVKLIDVPEPKCGNNQVKIEIEAAGICATDIHIYHGDFKCYPPVILGHEFSGRVVEIGKGVNEIKIGNRVTVVPSAARICGSCRWCKTGHYCFCTERRGMGHGVDGAFTKYCVVRKEIIYKLPDNIDLLSASLSEPLACCVQAVSELARVSAGDTVVVSGPGPIGLLTLQVAKAEGARVIVCGVSKDKERLQLSMKLGANLTVDIQKENLENVVEKMTDGMGVDVVFECSGATQAVKPLMELLRPMGRYVQVGLFGKTFQMNLDEVVYKQLQVLGSYGQTWSSWEKAFRLLTDEKVNMKPLISERLPLSQWEEGFKKVEEKDGLKILLYPGGIR